MKKKDVMIVVCIMLLSMAVTLFKQPQALATAPASLACWHDLDSVYGGYFNKKTLTYAEEKLNNNPDFHLSEGNQSAASTWSRELGFSINISTSFDTADIQIQGGTLDELVSEGWSGFSSSYAGLTDYNQLFKGVPIKYNNVEYTIYEFTTPNKIAIRDYNFGLVKYQYISTHEMGHALGMFGHTEDGVMARLMPVNVTSTQPSAKAIEHILQFYSGV
jgi:predicted Zn-dependent protease